MRKQILGAILVVLGLSVLYVGYVKAAGGDAATLGYDTPNSRDYWRVTSTGDMVPGATNMLNIGSSTLQVKKVNVVAGAIATADIAAGAIDTTKLGSGAVDTTKILTGAIDTTKILTGAIDTSKILPGAIDTSKVLTSGVVVNAALCYKSNGSFGTCTAASANSCTCN